MNCFWIIQKYMWLLLEMLYVVACALLITLPLIVAIEITYWAKSLKIVA